MLTRVHTYVCKYSNAQLFKMVFLRAYDQVNATLTKPCGTFILNTDCIPVQGCQTVYFLTKNFNLGKFWRVLQWKMFPFMRSILRSFGIFFAIWYIFGHLVYFNPFGMLYVPRKPWQP
jgi:hypothetical protein